MADEYQGHPSTAEEQDPDYAEDDARNCSSRSNGTLTALKLIAASALFYSAGTSFAETYHHMNHHNHNANNNVANLAPADLGMAAPSNHYEYSNPASHNTGASSNHRRLSEMSKKNPPSYMKNLMDDLDAWRKLMEDTPPEEVKYWFEYTGPLQVSSRLCVLLFLCG